MIKVVTGLCNEGDGATERGGRDGRGRDAGHDKLSGSPIALKFAFNLADPPISNPQDTITKRLIERPFIQVTKHLTKFLRRHLPALKYFTTVDWSSTGHKVARKHYLEKA